MGTALKILGDRNGDMSAVAFRPDGRSLASFGAGYLDFWNLANGQRLGTSPPAAQPETS